MKNRLFVALEIPDDVLDQIICIRNSVYGSDSPAKWEKKDKLHITLKFLGDTNEELLENVKKSMDDILSRHKAIDLQFSKFGMFYRDKNPSILWLGLQKSVALKELFLELESGFSSLGFKKEDREFRPHLTLLRIKGDENITRLKKLVEEPELDLKFDANKIILFKSTLLRSGSVYEVVENYFLK